MKKIVYSLLFLFSINLYNTLLAIDDIVDKDNLHNLIEGVNSSRAGTDRISSIYNISPLINHETPLKVGGSILNLKHIVDNSTIVEDSRQYSFLPRVFIGASYGIFAFGYQFDLYNNLNIKNSSVANSHSISFGFATDKYRFTFPLSFLSADENSFQTKLEISSTPKFSFLFRGGIVDEFTISLHYGIQLSAITNDAVSRSSTAPMVIGGSLYGNVILTRFTEYPVQITLPIKLGYYYGVGSRWATIDAGFAEDASINYIYDDNGGRSSDSMRFYISLPAKFESKLGALYTYIMPRLMFEGNLYKTDAEYNLRYGIEGELQITLVENLTFGLTAYGEGNSITKRETDFNFRNAFGAGLDIWGIWRY